MPKSGHHASPIDLRMESELREKLAKESRRLLRPEASLDGIPNAYFWDQALIQDEQNYAQFMDTLLHAGLFELC